MANNLAALARLDKLTLAIGEERFGQALFDTLRAAGDVDHCVLTVKAGSAPPRVRLNVGDIPSASRMTLTRAYQANPSEAGLMDASRVCPQISGAHWSRPHAGSTSSLALRRAWDACGVSDVVAMGGPFGGGVFSIQMLRLGGSQFLEAQRWLLEQIGGLVAANVAKHLTNLRNSGVGRSYIMGRILRDGDFSDLTTREREICIGILTGYTSQSLALNLGIAFNSVLTYRKRLYKKLGVNSQSELFACVVKAANTSPPPGNAAG